MNGIDLYRALETSSLSLVFALAIAGSEPVPAEAIGEDVRSIDTGETLPARA
jgi:hypothetical protein